MTDRSEQDDAALARQAQAGELAAFEELARRYQTPLTRFARRRLSHADAEEVVQDTLVSAYEHLAQFRANGSFKSWVFGIARNRIIDQFRARSPKPLGDEIEPDAKDDPTQAVEADDRKANLWATAKDALSEPQFSALWLFYAEQMPANDIAKAMGRSWVSVKVMLHRARTTLAGRLNEASFLDTGLPTRAEASKS